MDVRRLKSFIDDFYQPARSSTSTHVPQNADHDFLLFVWNTLLQQEGVSVGILRELKGKEKEEGEDDSDEEGEGEEAEGSKAKRVAMRTSKMKVLEPTHELVAIEGEARDVGMDELIEEHGAQLRISVASEMVWKAITGSFTRVSIYIHRRGDGTDGTRGCSLPPSRTRSSRSFNSSLDLAARDSRSLPLDRQRGSIRGARSTTSTSPSASGSSRSSE
jgi:hypothetical protein